MAHNEFSTEKPIRTQVQEIFKEIKTIKLEEKFERS